jgi:amidohydrolase
MNLFKKVIELTDEYRNRLIEYRRWFHSNPELSGNEKETALYVASVLESNDISTKRDVGGYGVVGLIKGKKDSKTVALRADMDALPLQDQKEHEYASRVQGVMHSCGHDAHTAILLGTATVLSRVKEEFNGNVKLIFQPSEEKADGGARFMIEEGVLKNPVPSAILALHVMPELPVGTIGCKPGVMTASSDRLSITIYGKSGHAARPHQTIDAVLVASKVITALQHIISRRIDPLHPAVITIGTIRGGSAENIVADKVELTGTVRSLNPDIRDQLPQLIEQVVKGTTMAMGANYQFNFAQGEPCLINAESVNSTIMECGRDLLGKDNVIALSEPSMGSEDFALFAEKVPGALFRLGVGNPEKKIIYPLHHNLFDIDEDALLVGAKMMAGSAIRLLNE